MRLDLFLFVLSAIIMLVAFTLPVPSHIRGMVSIFQLLQRIREVSPIKHQELVSIGKLPIYNYFGFMKFLDSQELDEHPKIKQLKEVCIFWISRRNRLFFISLIIELIQILVTIVALAIGISMNLI